MTKDHLIVVYGSKSGELLISCTAITNAKSRPALSSTALDLWCWNRPPSRTSVIVVFSGGGRGGGGSGDGGGVRGGPITHGGGEGGGGAGGGEGGGGDQGGGRGGGGDGGGKGGGGGEGGGGGGGNGDGGGSDGGLTSPCAKPRKQSMSSGSGDERLELIWEAAAHEARPACANPAQSDHPSRDFAITPSNARNARDCSLAGHGLGRVVEGSSVVPLAASANPASALVAAWTPGRAVEARPKERLIPGEPAGVCVPTRSWGNSRKVEQLRWQ